MLGGALLDSSHWPDIVLRSVSPVPAAEERGQVLASIEATVRGESHVLTVPVQYQFDGDVLEASGTLSLRQTQLGLKPFSAFLGALVVQDEMLVQFQLRARADTR
jgi:hypothetical protein